MQEKPRNKQRGLGPGIERLLLTFPTFPSRFLLLPWVLRNVFFFSFRVILCRVREFRVQIKNYLVPGKAICRQH